MKPFVLSAVSGCLYIFAAVPAIAQVIPAADGVGTQVIQAGDLIEITGGQLSGDHANLFHSFEAFGLGADQIADFQVLPNIENVLGRVVGGSGSVIDGVMRVSGGEANLYLIDPAGIVFGENARLDVAGDFVGTTATSIGFGDRWLDVAGGNDWASFVGSPSGFAFDGSGVIVNLGDLEVDPGQSIGLLGGAVINTGTLSANGGGVAIVASESGDQLRLGIPGNVLSLEVDREAIHENATVLALPELLAGAVESAGSIVREADGSIRLGASPVAVNPLVGDALVSGVVDVSSDAGVGGSALVLGERVGLLAGAIEGSGRDGGGVVNVGGNFQGNGVLPNAELTVVDGGSSIVLDGVVLGDGGRAIVWADGATRFGGEVLARGGAEGGDGGFVEVSGKRFLDFVGFVDTSAVNGEFGTLLLDPETLTLIDAYAASGDLDLYYLFSPPVTVNFDDPDVGSNTLAWGTITSAGTGSNIVLEARGDIYIADIRGNVSAIANTVLIDAYGGSLRIKSYEGSIEFEDTTDTLATNYADVVIEAPNSHLSLGNIITNRSAYIRSSQEGQSITLLADGNISAGDLSANAYPLTVKSNSGSIELGFVLNTNFTNSNDGAPLIIEAPGNIRIGDINSGGSSIAGGSGSASDISIVSSLGSIEVGTVGNQAASGNGGTLTFSAWDTINFIRSLSQINGYGPGSQAPTVNISTVVGDISIPGLVILGAQGGEVSVTSRDGDINLNSGISLTPIDFGSTVISGAGNINISTQNGSIYSDLGSEISAYRLGNGDGGDISIYAGRDIVLGSLLSLVEGSGDAGDVSIISREGSIDISSGTINSFNTRDGSSGNVTIRAFGDIKTSSILAVSRDISRVGGGIEVISETGSVSTFTPLRGTVGTLQTTNLSGQGSSIRVLAAEDITAGSLITTSRANAGSIQLTAGGDIGISVSGGQIELRSVRNDGGVVDLVAGGNIILGDVNSSAYLNGGDIKLSSNGSIDTTSGTLNSIGGISGGSIQLRASDNISTSNIAIIRCADIIRRT